jgi:replicative DNA helicase
VIFIHRPNLYKQDLAEEERAKADIIVAKQRNGPIGSLAFIFLSRNTRFEQAAPDAWLQGDI